MAQTTTWFSGQSDNSATYAALPGYVASTVQTSLGTGWDDFFASEQTPNTLAFGTPSLQSSPPNGSGLNESLMVWGFSGTGLNSADVPAPASS